MATIAIGISPKAGGGYTTRVPVSALAEDGVPPEEGDSVSFSVEGKVQDVSGDTATVDIDSINGEPIGEAGEGTPEEEAQEETEGGSGGGSGGAPTSGASPRTSLDTGLAPMGRAAAPGVGPAPVAPGLGFARNRLDRAGTAAIRNRLMKGARGQPLPF